MTKRHHSAACWMPRVVVFVGFVASYFILCAQTGACNEIAKGTEFSEYELVEAETRNILFVGRQGSDKSTLIKVLQNKDYSPPLTEIIGGTGDVEISSFTLQNKLGNKKYHLNILDASVLFDAQASVHIAGRNEEAVLNLIDKCVDREITKINHVYFVTSIENEVKLCLKCDLGNI